MFYMFFIILYIFLFY